jgi:hypothetical protein
MAGSLFFASHVSRSACPGAHGSPFKLPIKAISAKGVSCAAAYKFLALLVNNKSPKTPEKYKCTSGHFKAPVGFIPQVCTKPGARIQYAQQGG